jgi:phosphoserine phosphatase
VLDPSPWPACVEAALAAPPGLVAFDMDGTLIEGDVGELLMLRRVDAGEPTPGLRAWLGAGDLRAAYLAALAVPPPEHHYVACVLGGEGLDADDVGARVRGFLDEGAIRGRPPVLALLRALAGAGHRVVVVTGSLRLVAEALVAALDLPVGGVIGQELVMRGARLGGRISGPVLCGAGKVRAWREAGLDAPLLVVGDTPADLPLMGIAVLGAVGVPRRGAPLVAAARAAGVPVVLFDD